MLCLFFLRERIDLHREGGQLCGIGPIQAAHGWNILASGSASFGDKDLLLFLRLKIVHHFLPFGIRLLGRGLRALLIFCRRFPLQMLFRRCLLLCEVRKDLVYNILHCSIRPYFFKWCRTEVDFTSRTSEVSIEVLDNAWLAKCVQALRDCHSVTKIAHTQWADQVLIHNPCLKNYLTPLKYRTCDERA